MIWKAIVKSFHLIENNLVWDVGNGESVLIGRDPWPGSTQQHLLPIDVIEVLVHRGITTLNHLADPRPAEPWTQFWRRANSLGLGDWATGYLEIYLREPDPANIILSEQEDSLVWEADPGGGIYSKGWVLIPKCRSGTKGRILVVDASVETKMSSKNQVVYVVRTKQ